MSAAATYAQQQCFSSFEECNKYSPCAYLSSRRNCSASLASLFTTCTSGPANLNSSNLAHLDMANVTKSNATSTWIVSTTEDVTVDGEDQFVCDAVNENWSAIPGASGMLCYPNATACASDPLNPCSAATPCAQDLTWCGSGMALAFGSLQGYNNSWACTALQVPNGTLPQGNEFQCFDTQENCGACPRYGCGVVASSSSRLTCAIHVASCRVAASSRQNVHHRLQRKRRGLHGRPPGGLQRSHGATSGVPL